MELGHRMKTGSLNPIPACPRLPAISFKIFLKQFNNTFLNILFPVLKASLFAGGYPHGNLPRHNVRCR